MLAAMPFAVAASFQATVYAIKNRDNRPKKNPPACLNRRAIISKDQAAMFAETSPA
jgi:hypothetical protein